MLLEKITYIQRAYRLVGWKGTKIINRVLKFLKKEDYSIANTNRLLVPYCQCYTEYFEHHRGQFRKTHHNKLSKSEHTFLNRLCSSSFSYASRVEYISWLKISNVVKRIIRISYLKYSESKLRSYAISLLWRKLAKIIKHDHDVLNKVKYNASYGAHEGYHH